MTVDGLEGIYTSQTKSLWLDRLKREKKSMESSPLPVPSAKPLKRLSISYAFTSSPLFQEQVWPSHCFIPATQ